MASAYLQVEPAVVVIFTLNFRSKTKFIITQ